MAAEYQEPDWRVADYAPFCLDEKIIDPTTKRPLNIRGPKPARLDRGGYFVCLGAAQTFGRFCQRPFPTILAERLAMPVLNISHGGAGPAFYCKNNERLLDYLNGACFVVVQVMSGRSDSNSMFESEGVGHFRRRLDGSYIGCDEAFRETIRTQPRSVLARVVEETRRSWCGSYARLLSGISVPKVLLWFATRPPAYKQGWGDLSQLYGEFPQLVNPEMVSDVRSRCERYVECVTKRGLPQTLLDRFTGKRTAVTDPWTSGQWKKNWYYPSTQMHEDAAASLEPACRSLIEEMAKNGARCRAGG
jgi:hypothetical protein